MYSIRDIIKKSFLEGYSASDITLKTVCIAIVLTAIIGLYIFLVYRLVTRKTFYSKNFNISLVAVAMITAAIIITIQSSIVVSLGMVGALSIVRFRTAVKEPMDLAFLFWSISTGIICGAGFAEYAIILAIFLTIIIALLEFFPTLVQPLILVVNSTDKECEKKIVDILSAQSKAYRVKSRNMTKSSVDLVVELRAKSPDVIVKSIVEIEGVQSASIIDHNGETTF